MFSATVCFRLLLYFQMPIFIWTLYPKRVRSSQTESNRMTSLRMNSVLFVLCATREINAAAGMRPQKPIVGFRQSQSISLCLHLHFCSPVSLLTWGSTGVRQRPQNHLSVNSYNLALLKVLLHLDTSIKTLYSWYICLVRTNSDLFRLTGMCAVEREDKHGLHKIWWDWLWITSNLFWSRKWKVICHIQ